MKFTIFLLLLFVSCYNAKKAGKQFAKAAVTYPSIPEDYCALTFPPKITVIKGDTVILTDTVELQGDVITDTIIDLDTVRITKVVTLPGKTITRTVTIMDTILVENMAQLKVCERNRDNAITLATIQTAEANKYKGRARTKGIILYSLLGLVILLGAWKVYGMFKPKLKAI